MSRFRTIKLTAKTIDGVIKEFPQTFNLICGRIVPVGEEIIRNYTGSDCIKAVKVFLIYYEGQSLGTTDFKNADEFISFVNSSCTAPCDKDFLQMDGCFAMVDGCSLFI